MINPSTLKNTIITWCFVIRATVVAYAIWSLAFKTSPDYMMTATVMMTIVVTGFFYVYHRLAKSAANQFTNTMKINRLVAIMWSILASYVVAWSFLPCPACDEYAGQRAAVGFSVFTFFALVHWVFHVALKRLPPPHAR